VLQVLGAGQNLKTADLLGEKILIGVIYRKEEARCRELNEDIPGATDGRGHYGPVQHEMCHDEMKAYSFEGKDGHYV
jgi:hypothetical protein